MIKAFENDDDPNNKFDTNRLLEKVVNLPPRLKVEEMGSSLETQQDDYKLYLEIANLPSKPFGDEILTFEEFVAVNYQNHLANLGFALPVSTVVGALQGVSTVKGYLSAARTARQEVADAIDELRDIADQAQGLGNEFIRVLGQDNSDGGGSTPVSNGPGGYHHFNANILFEGVKPIEVRLNTPVKPNCYGANFQAPDGYFSPLHMTQTKLSFTSFASGADPKNYLEIALIAGFQTLAQRAVSFNINASTNLSYNKVTTYYDALARGLSYYYFYASVIAFTEVTPINNEAMYKLRNMMSADDLNSLNMLKRVLEGSPIPPNLNHLIFWMSQTYRQSELPGSALIKIMPFGFASTTDTNYKFSALPGLITSALNDLINPDILETRNLLSRICPDWQAERLGAPTSVALHDPNFTTLFINLFNISVTSNGTGFRTPNTTSADTSVNFATHTNDLDGAIQALMPIYNTSLSAWYPSLLDWGVQSIYATTRYTNRVSYIKLSDGSNSFVPVSGNANIAISRGEVSINQTTANLTQVPFGTEIVLNVNINSIKETTQKLLEWLLSLDTVGSGVKELKTASVRRSRHVNEVGGNRNSSDMKSKFRKKAK